MFALGNSNMYTAWDVSWVNPFESPWCTMNKFALANACSISYFATTDGGIANNNRRLGLISRRRIDFKKYAMLLPDAHRKELYEDSTSNKKNKHLLSDRIISSKLRFCPDCLEESGYHSMLHQNVLYSRCPIHDTQLTATCPFCHREMPYTINPLIQELLPFGCPICGETLFKKSLTPSLINIWIDHSINSITDKYHFIKDQLYVFSTGTCPDDLSAQLVHDIQAARETEDITLGNFSLVRGRFNKSKNIYKCDFLEELYYHAIKKTDAIIVRKYGIHISTEAVDLNQILCCNSKTCKHYSSVGEVKECAYLLWTKEMYDCPIIKNAASIKSTFVMRSISRVFAIDFTVALIDAMEARRTVDEELCYEVVFYLLVELLEKRYKYWLRKIENNELHPTSYYDDCRQLPQAYYILLINSDAKTMKMITNWEDK